MFSSRTLDDPRRRHAPGATPIIADRAAWKPSAAVSVGAPYDYEAA